MPETTLDRPNAAEFTLTVTLDPQDYRSRADAELKRMARTAKIKGFRPGKVPASFMRKTYGRGAVAEAIGKSVDEAINQAIMDNELEVFGQLQPVDEPDLSRIDPEFAEPLTFVFEGGLIPKVDTVDTSGLSAISRYTVALSDAEADEKLAQAMQRLTDYIERDTVETEDDFATLVVADAALDAKFIGAAGAAHSAEPTVGNDAKANAPQADTAEHDADAGGASESTGESDYDDDDDDHDDDSTDKDPRQRYFLRPVELVEDSRYKLIDRARGTEVILALADLREDVRERYAEVIPADETATFTIAKVDRRAVPEASPETFQTVFGEDTDVTTVEEARAEFARRFAQNSQSNLDDFTLEEVIDALAATNEVPVPAKAIKTRLELALEEERAEAAKSGKAPEQDRELTEADRHGLGRRLRWMAFRNALLKEHGVELAREDIDAGIEAAYARQFREMGIDPEMFRERFFDQFRQNFLQNREKTFEMTDELLTAKLLRALEDAGVLAPRRHVTEAEFSRTVDDYNQRVHAELQGMRSQVLS